MAVADACARGGGGVAVAAQAQMHDGPQCNPRAAITWTGSRYPSALVAIPEQADRCKHHDRGGGDGQPGLAPQEHAREVDRGHDVADARGGMVAGADVERRFIEVHEPDEPEKAVPEELQDVG